MVDTNFYQQDKWKILSFGLIGLIAAIGIGVFLVDGIIPKAIAAKPVPYVASSSFQVPAGSTNGSETTCNTGDKVTGGGYHYPLGATVSIFYNGPISPTSLAGWSVGAQNNGADVVTVDIFALCTP